MTKYHVSWSGVARRTFAVPFRPSDALYLLWTHHREDIAPGSVTFDAAGVVTFPVAVEAVLEADDMPEAAAALRERHATLDMGGDGVVTVDEVPS